MPPISPWPRARASAALRRLRTGWADPRRQARALPFLATANITLVAGLALLVETRTGLALIAAGLLLMTAVLSGGLALLILWGRDL
jgi:predicted lysophospholipase L1 biosynthesis ABC-type transport system permease subunit